MPESCERSLKQQLPEKIDQAFPMIGILRLPNSSLYSQMPLKQKKRLFSISSLTLQDSSSLYNQLKG